MVAHWWLLLDGKMKQLTQNLPPLCPTWSGVIEKTVFWQFFSSSDLAYFWGRPILRRYSFLFWIQYLSVLKKRVLLTTKQNIPLLTSSGVKWLESLFWQHYHELLVNPHRLQIPVYLGIVMNAATLQEQKKLKKHKHSKEQLSHCLHF